MPLRLLDRARKKLGVRLTLWYSTIFILSSVILFIVAYLFLSSSLEDHRETVELKLREYLSLAQEGGVPAIQRALEDDQDDNQSTHFFVRILDLADEVVFASSPELWEKFDVKPHRDRPIEGEWQYFPAKQGGDVLEITYGFLPNGYLLEVGKTIEDRNEILEHFQDTIAGVLIPMILISLGGGAFLAFRSLRPIRNLIYTTQSIIDTGRMDARVPIGKTGDELDELSGLFNRMLERIEGLIRGMREALDNVAHDLRTPMTRLRSIAESSLQLQPGRERYEEALADCLEESERVLTLLNTLMDISEAETGTMKLSLVPVNISNLIEDTVGMYEYVAEDKTITISVNCAKDIDMTADRNRMSQVLANLLDNAIKYTPHGGNIVIDAYQEREHTVILVKDSGIGITSDEVPKIWDRLYRGDKSRTEPGLGLGLSLVKAVVGAHKGRIEVDSKPGAGSVFTLYLPNAAIPVR
jgi:signal transduction histidine kinase